MPCHRDRRFVTMMSPIVSPIVMSPMMSPIVSEAPDMSIKISTVTLSLPHLN